MSPVGTDPNVDSMVAIYIPPMVTKPEEAAAGIARGAAAIPAHKPVLSVFISSAPPPRELSAGRRGKLPAYKFPENAALPLASACRHVRLRAPAPAHVHHPTPF